MWRTRCSMLSSLIGLALVAGFAAPAAAANAPMPVYAVPPPETILVILPGAAPPQWVVAPDSVLPPGVDLAAAMPPAMARLIADQEADLARLAAAAETLAAAPDRALQTALAEMPRLGPGEASGVVMTTVTTGRGSCSETVTYSYPGNGAVPRVAVRKAGNACPAGSPFIAGTEPGVIPTVRPQSPRLLEAAGPPDRLIPTGPMPQSELVSYPPAR
jgi:hypothetical protein